LCGDSEPNLRGSFQSVSMLKVSTFSEDKKELYLNFGTMADIHPLWTSSFSFNTTLQGNVRPLYTFYHHKYNPISTTDCRRYKQDSKFPHVHQLPALGASAFFGCPCRHTSRTAED
jgi:hypothetical protein